MRLKLNKGLLQAVEQNPDDRIHPSKDERYTVSYIEREASIILQHLSYNKKKDFGNMRLGKGVRGNSELDKRIQRRWGIN